MNNLLDYFLGIQEGEREVSNVFSGQQPFLENRVLVYEFLSALGQGFSRFPFGRAGGGSGHQYFKHLSDFNGH